MPAVRFKTNGDREYRANSGRNLPSPAGSSALSVEFDGIDESVTFGNTFNFENNDPFTINMWVKPVNITARSTLFAKATNDANVFGFMVYHESDGALFIQARASAQLRQYKFATSFVTANVWQMVTVTYNGTQNINGFIVYVNGTVGATPTSGVITNTWLYSQDFIVGRRNTAFPYTGFIDEVSIWDKALNSSEVTELYNGGLPNDLFVHSSETNLVTWLRMGDGDAFPTLLDLKNSNDGTMSNMAAGNIQGDVPT